jgi:plasmid stabilization system protein ParE
VKVLYRQAARDDVIRQFRYYLIERDLPEVAVRFRSASRATIEFLGKHPLVGARYRLGHSQFHNLRSWPVAGFEAIRIFYLAEDETLHIVRVLHGKRDLQCILEREGNS